MKVCLNCGFRFSGQEWRCPRCGFEPDQSLGYPQFAPEFATNAEGFDSTYFIKLSHFEPGNFWFESRNALILWAIQKYFPNAQQFMEVGCGTGFVLMGLHQSLPKLRLSGSEIFNEGLQILKERMATAVTLLQMDIGQIPFEDEFDVIGAFDVLEHIPDDEVALQQIHQAVKPGGGILLSVPQHPALWSTFDTYAHHQRRYTRKELVEKVTQAGFKVNFVTSFVSLPMPAMILSRLRSKQPSPDYDMFAEFYMHPLTNRLLTEVLSLERLLIQRGITLPVGGSLLMAATRIEP